MQILIDLDAPGRINHLEMLATPTRLHMLALARRRA